MCVGAYKIGRADLASLFAEKSRVSSKNLGIPEANVASQVYLIRHLALLSMESSDVKAIKSRYLLYAKLINLSMAHYLRGTCID